jgi:hypothetical protein
MAENICKFEESEIREVQAASRIQGWIAVRGKTGVEVIRRD